jgi:alpha-tubulin suppressor-like RCC1 family protein
MGINLMSVDLGTGRTAKQIVAGWYHNCAVLDDSDVKCWGDGRMGQLGTAGPSKVGNRPGDIGDNLPPVNPGRSNLKLGDPGFGDRNFRIGVKQLTAGQSHNCALLTSNYVKCWGANAEGQLGIGDTRNRGIISEQMGDNLSSIPIGLHPLVTQINAGGGHTCVLRVDNSIRCWGKNLNGELGLGHTNNIGDNPGEVAIILPRSIFSPSDAPIIYR